MAKEIIADRKPNPTDPTWRSGARLVPTLLSASSGVAEAMVNTTIEAVSATRNHARTCMHAVIDCTEQIAKSSFELSKALVEAVDSGTRLAVAEGQRALLVTVDTAHKVGADAAAIATSEGRISTAA